MSIISSGTTTTTALVQTGNTDGTLQLQVNGTTPALTLSTAGAIGVGSTPGYGTSGQVLTSAGTGSAPTWATLAPSGTGVTTYSNQSANVTLTSSDANKVLVFTLANDITVTLPDATTLTSAKAFTIKNNSTTYGIYVNDGAGNYLFAVPPRTSQDVYVTTTATVAGTWTTSNLPAPYLTEPTNSNPLSNLYNNSFQYTATLNSTQAVLAYVVGRSYEGASSVAEIFAVVVTNTSGVLTYGTPTLIGQGILTTFNFYPVAVTCLSSTSGIVAYDYYGGTSSFGGVIAVGFTVSGTTITAGSGTVVGSTGGRAFNLAIANNSATTAYLGFAGQSATNMFVCVLSLAGTTVTNGAITDFGVSNTQYGAPFSIAGFSATGGIIAFIRDSGAVPALVAFTSSGTTITSIGTSVSLSIASVYGASVVALSSTSFVACYISGGVGVCAVSGTVSGATITANGTITQYLATSTAGGGLVAESSTTAILFGISTTTAQARKLTISGTTISAGTTYTTLAAVTGANFYNSSLAAFQTVAVAAPNTTSVLATFQNATTGAQLISQNLTESGGVITANSVYSQNRATPSYFLPPQNVATVSTTQFVEMCYSPNAEFPYTLYARLYSVSNGTITLQNTLTITNTAYAPSSTGYSSSSNDYCIFPITATLVGFIYRNSSGGLVVNTITISGSSLTLNTGITVTDGANYRLPSACMLTSTSFIMSAYDTASGNYTRTVSISGTTLTANAVLSGFSSSVNPLIISALTPTVLLIAQPSSSGAGSFTINKVTISGTTVVYNGSFLGALNVQPPYNSDANMYSRGQVTGIYPLSATRALISVARTGVLTNGTDSGLAAYIYDFTSSYTTVAITPCAINNQTSINGFTNASPLYGALVPTTATSGVFIAAATSLGAGAAIPASNVVVGTWTIQGATITYTPDYATANKFNNYVYAGVNGSLAPYPFVAPSTGARFASNFILRYPEFGTLNAASNSCSIVLRKFSTTGAIN